MRAILHKQIQKQALQAGNSRAEIGQLSYFWTFFQISNTKLRDTEQQKRLSRTQPSSQPLPKKGQA